MLLPWKIGPFPPPSNQGEDVSLGDFRGKKVVLCFYQKDVPQRVNYKKTKAFQERSAEFEQKGVVIH